MFCTRRRRGLEPRARCIVFLYCTTCTYLFIVIVFSNRAAHKSFSTLGFTMVWLRCFSAAALLLAVVDAKASSWRKIRRVKAGKQYEDHEAVHVVVNKVG